MFLKFKSSLFCEDGYHISSASRNCVRNNSTIEQHASVVKCPEEMNIELSVNNEMCLLIEGLNDTLSCRLEVFSKEGNIIRAFHKVISEILGVDRERISNVTMVSLLTGESKRFALR